MQKIHKLRTLTRLILILGDLLCVPSAYFLSYWIRSKSALFLFQERMPFDRIELVNHRLWVLLVLHIILLYLHGFYDTLSLGRRFEIMSTTVRIVTFEILILVSVYFFSQDILFPRSIFLLLWILLISFTWIWHLWWRRKFSEKQPDRKILVVGTYNSVQNILREIDRFPTYGLEIAGVIPIGADIGNWRDIPGCPVLGRQKDLVSLIKKYEIDEVILASEGSWQEELVGDIGQLKEIPARICILPNCYEILIGKIKHLRLYDIPLIEMIKPPETLLSKRYLDLFVALLLLILTVPAMILCSLAILITMGTPILFRQERLGKGQKPFTILKFRTMIRNAEKSTGPILTSDSDQRVTRLGRFLRKYRFDELPQLINILRGEMSFVGPRPERPFFVKKYLNEVKGYGERFKALPGLTGLAQVNGGYDTKPENKLKYDLAYIHNYSIWLDLKIVVETIKVILTGRINP